jgi:hypothetical protein
MRRSKGAALLKKAGGEGNEEDLLWEGKSSLVNQHAYGETLFLHVGHRIPVSYPQLNSSPVGSCPKAILTRE